MNQFLSSKQSDKDSSVQAKRNSIGQVTIAICIFNCIGFSMVFIYQAIYPLNIVFICFTLSYALTYYIFIKKSKLAGKILLYTGMLVHTFFLSWSLGEFVQIKLFYIP